MVHGDDFLVLTDADGHSFVDAELAKRYEFKCDGHVGGGCEKDTMTVFKRVVNYGRTTGSVTYEADPRHVEALGLETVKSSKNASREEKRAAT